MIRLDSEEGTVAEVRVVLADHLEAILLAMRLLLESQEPIMLISQNSQLLLHVLI